MRIVFVGASGVAKMTTESLVSEGHDVVIIEWNKEKIEEMSETLDCGFIHGDGTKPDILKEADPKKTDVLFCNTHEDQSNIIANLLAHSLGYKRVVTLIRNPDLERLCSELQLANTIIPRRMTSNYLHELVYGKDIIEQYSVLKYGACLFPFIATEKEAKEVKEIQLPKRAQIAWFYREKDFIAAQPQIRIKPGDEVVIICHVDTLGELRDQFAR